jgi:hypothetical protein
MSQYEGATVLNKIHAFRFAIPVVCNVSHVSHLVSSTTLHCPQDYTKPFKYQHFKLVAVRNISLYPFLYNSCLCGLVVRVHRGPGSIPGATRFSEK